MSLANNIQFCIRSSEKLFATLWATLGLLNIEMTVTGHCRGAYCTVEFTVECTVEFTVECTVEFTVKCSVQYSVQWSLVQNGVYSVVYCGVCNTVHFGIQWSVTYSVVYSGVYSGVKCTVECILKEYCIDTNFRSTLFLNTRGWFDNDRSRTGTQNYIS